MDVQWNLSLGTPPSLYFITSIETTPLFSWGKGHFFWVPKPGLNLHFISLNYASFQHLNKNFIQAKWQEAVICIKYWFLF